MDKSHKSVKSCWPSAEASGSTEAYMNHFKLWTVASPKVVQSFRGIRLFTPVTPTFKKPKTSDVCQLNSADLEPHRNRCPPALATNFRTGKCCKTLKGTSVKPYHVQTGQRNRSCQPIRPATPNSESWCDSLSSSAKQCRQQVI